MTVLAVLLGKVLRFALRLRGGGSAVPGRIALLLQPKFLQIALGNLPQGVFFVSGSNGKSTTTAMLVAILREHGLNVLTNPAGANLPQGLASALLAEVNFRGRLQSDIAVLEVDEAYGKLIARKITPNGLLLTNLQLDQLNRFHSPEEVSGYLTELASLTSEFLIVNGSDPGTESIGFEHQRYLDVEGVYVAEDAIASAAHGLVAAPSFKEDLGTLPTSATLLGTKGLAAQVTSGSEKFEVKLPSAGLHYAIDAALAIASANKILGAVFSKDKAVAAFEKLKSVYGRGEVLQLDDQELQLIMMKNLPSLQVNLDALESKLENVWISVDEGTPDPSWIYDIDLSKLGSVAVVSGTKTYQWATRLAYAGISTAELIESESAALKHFLGLPGKHKVAIVNYEQMMWIRKQLGFLDLEGSDV